MHHLLSDRLRALPASATIAINQQAAALRAAGHTIINLSIGEPNFPTPLFIQQAAKQAIDEGAYFSYPPGAGYPDLRAALAEKLRSENNIPCTPSQVVVTNGAKQALANVFLSLINPGDEVIVYTPCWGSYLAVIQLMGGKPVLLSGDPAQNFAVPPAQLEQALTPRTKAVVFSSPCNPTGQVFSRSALEAMAAVLEKHPQVFVIADEIYEYINFVGEHVSIGSFPSLQDRVITVNGFSKGFAMTGWRVGYLAAPEWLAQACEKAQGQLTFAVCAIAQRAALAAIQGDRSAVHEMTQAYQARRDFCLAFFKNIPGLRCSQPAGAFYLFPDVSAYFGCTDGKTSIQNAQDLCQYLLQTAHVALVPGVAFGASNCLRISYGAAEEDLRTALQRMQTALAQLRKG
ncbi:MAG: pyridoxal phosphate-dependent aminotransferase [Roseivirga sp.]